VSFVSAQRGWVLGSGQLLTTDDGALSWQPGQLGQVLSLETASRPTAYLVGQEGAGPIPPSVEVYTGTLAGRHQAVPCPASLPVPDAELGASTDGSLVLIWTSRASRPSTTWRTSPLTGVGLDGHHAASGLVERRDGGHRQALLVERERPVSSREAWTVALAGPPGGFSLVGFETDQQGVALATDGALWITGDGGSTWSLVSFAG
jgi:photosystem II stability/assembly factor-like uncharacterized protein